ncbi:MAG: carbamoyltransferase HypF [Chloroflexota bacterium]|nr:carbamoyltransferase HypF [Chloroflexota bacterium]
MAVAAPKLKRLRICVQGTVQGVGFRPFVYGLALRCRLTGFVFNSSAGVTIEVEGDPEALASFERALCEETPALARIDSLSTAAVPPTGSSTFVITHSLQGAERNTAVPADAATCEQCLAEINDPASRRYLYPFTNCTNCGPRFTIVLDVPYDRANTTMQPFTMCPRCQGEYDDPLNRRFHAQPNACPKCGPSLSLLSDGRPVEEHDPIGTAAKGLAAGAIYALKGLGGYHLACDACNQRAVSRLRERKHREARPFAIMVPDLETAQELCHMSAAEARLLQSHRRPIVLMRRKEACEIASSVALDYPTIGVMLPYTPLHHLLLQAFASSIGQSRPAALVMTSGNLGDEPIAYGDSDAQRRLAPLADAILLHDREIHVRCDDSVARIAAGGEQIFRRSRGYAPEPLTLPVASPLPLLACGGHLKNSFCLVKGAQAFVSHHIGDLENVETQTSFREGIQHFGRLFDIYPQAVAHDLHPEYLATKHALDLDLPRKIGVQHHHAHIASVIAEHSLEGPVIGVAADGTGYGTDGAIWGCEVMMARLLDFKRLAHLEYLPLPGGEQAVRQPWRMAALYLQRAFGDAFLDLKIPFTEGLDQARWRPISQMAERGINSPQTSSLGRLFDAVSALLGVRSVALYEGQAAIELESLAQATTGYYPFTLRAQSSGSPSTLSVLPAIRGIVADIEKGELLSVIAGRFHRTVVEMLASACVSAREESGQSRVALSGGVFQNRMLLEQLAERLQDLRFSVYTNRLVPPNDGGLSFGQAAVAAARLRHEIEGF